MSNETRSRKQLREEIDRLNLALADLQKRHEAVQKERERVEAWWKIQNEWLFHHGSHTGECWVRTHAGRGGCTCGLAHALNPRYNVITGPTGEPMAVDRPWQPVAAEEE